MLRTYKSISHTILTIDELVNYIVCDYWCNARKGSSLLFDDRFTDFFYKLPVFRGRLLDIYDLCRELSDVERNDIVNAFKNHNDIENLCNGNVTLFVKPLSYVVEVKMKPFFVDLYEEYSERKTLKLVYGSKADYYNKLYEENRFVDCPCCCLDVFEPEESGKREDFDHYLPKSVIPFASVNYNNLVPLCHKCNRTYKSDTNPIKDKKICFYPFEGKNNNVNVTIELDDDIENPIRELRLSGDDIEKIKTWDKVFSMTTRYRNVSNQIKPSFLRRLKRRNRARNETIEETCKYFINEYQEDNDIYLDKKFLKVPIMEAILKDEDFIEQFK
ncbi:hypothetical protein CXF68_01965 [Tenacibaculum sp. Bg11-29]|uniref:hypothetical protein n=1 Tax=Tenacibaculum sp. Bg11-29 TaxID=2058306 RepID=UPI000C31D92B|nr:hypothetical protein [Tenacibaculum sp. Bg11-29]PKH49529.1 hypothetical protein CXF68_01965 [Tenacibaculum sp. Bg11-29]